MSPQYLFHESWRPQTPPYVACMDISANLQLLVNKNVIFSDMQRLEFCMLRFHPTYVHVSCFKMFKWVFSEYSSTIKMVPYSLKQTPTSPYDQLLGTQKWVKLMIFVSKMLWQDISIFHTVFPVSKSLSEKMFYATAMSSCFYTTDVIYRLAPYPNIQHYPVAFISVKVTNLW